MKNSFRYEPIIKEKLEHLPTPDVNDLWSRMEIRLDAEMPVSQPKRPGATWMISPVNSGLLAAACIIAAVFIIKTNTPSIEDSLAEVNTVHTIENKISNSNPNATTSGGVNNTSNKKDITTITSITPNRNSNNNQNTYLLLNSTSSSTNNIAIFKTEKNNEAAFLINTNSPSSLFKATEIATGILGTSVNVNTNKEAIATPFLTAQKPTLRQNGWMNNLTIGLSMNFNAPVNGQKLNFYNSTNMSGLLYDYLPSIHIQYPLSKKVYAQAELQLISPQYTAGNMLYKKTTELNPDEKEEDIIKATKLYYMNLPVTVHYKVSDNFSFGAGVQVSKLKQMVLTEEKNYHIKSGSGWNTTLLSKKTLIKSVPTAEEKINMTSAADTVAQSFAPTDVKLVVDAGYHINNFHIGVRYNQGMGNNYDTKQSPDVVPTNNKNSSLQMYVRYNLFGKKK